jgi:hypothetical protein
MEADTVAVVDGGIRMGVVARGERWCAMVCLFPGKPEAIFSRDVTDACVDLTARSGSAQLKSCICLRHQEPRGDGNACVISWFDK